MEGKPVLQAPVDPGPERWQCITPSHSIRCRTCAKLPCIIPHVSSCWFQTGAFGMNGELYKQNFDMEKSHVESLQTRTTGWFYLGCLGGFLLLLFLGIGVYFF